MDETRRSDDADGSTEGRGMTPRAIQRVENGLFVMLAMTGTVIIAPGLWWFPLAVFLMFDLSMLGYTRSPAVGAAWYNAIHTYAWPTILAVIALLASASFPTASLWLGLTAFAWGFHVGVDRMLGYGLKLPDAFTHTHLGRIGQARDRAPTRPESHAS